MVWCLVCGVQCVVSGVWYVVCEKCVCMCVCDFVVPLLQVSGVWLNDLQVIMHLLLIQLEAHLASWYIAQKWVD